MANTGYTSPFPTSHDTIGQSTLATPLFMPSSPPKHTSSPPESPLPAHSPTSDHFPPQKEDGQAHASDDEQRPENEANSPSRPATPGSPSGSDLDARLAEYTLDFSQFPSRQFQDTEDDTLPNMNEDVEDQLSDVGGPEDFTENMEKYLMGGSLPSARKSSRYTTDEVSGSASRHGSIRSRQAAVEEENGEEQEEAGPGDYSEFGPPVDMSTPSHLLRRASALARDSTQLEDIEEDDGDVSGCPSSPSVQKSSNASVHNTQDIEVHLHHRIAQLEEAVRGRDEQLQKNRTRVLEAASAGEQIRHLQSELQRKNAWIEEIESRGGDEAALRERLESLKKQNEERDKSSQQPNMSNHDLSALQQQLRDMQQQLQTRDTPTSVDTERLETIAHLRQQLDLTQEQLKKRDATLDETMIKLREVTRAKEVQLHEKNAEIDRLKAEIDDQALENERRETEMDRVNTDYQALEDRLTSLKTQNQPLEERNHSLEADLTRVQSQVEAQENALKAVAADLPLGSRSTYSEILDLIKDLGDSGPEIPLKEKSFEDPDVQQLHQEITKLQQELQDTAAAQKAADAEAIRLRQQATETQTLIKTIDAENTRLSTRVEELTSTLNKTQHELTRTKEEHAVSLETVARLQEESLGQPPSPPPSPPKARGASNPESSEVADTAALEASHQGQLRSLQTAHSTAISTLRASHAESMRKIRNQLTAAEEREAKLRTELTSLRTSVSTQDSQLRRSFKAEINRLEGIIAAKDETAAAMDERIALSVDKREREWERRVDLLLKERDRMAKALMMYWGEKEMGRGPGVLAEGKELRRRDGERAEAKQGQAYKYKFSEKRKSRGGEKKA